MTFARCATLSALALLAACGRGSPAATQPRPLPAPIAAPVIPPPADAPRLALPIACEIGVTCEIQNYLDRDPGAGVQDYLCGERTYEAHRGIDFRIPDMAAQRAGVAVLAAAPGTVSRLRDGVEDISVRTAGVDVSNRQCGNGVVVDHGSGWETQYCHLARGSIIVKAGDAVTTGQALAKVGLSGNTEYPHLHLTVRHNSVTIDPFAPIPGTSCNPRTSPGSSLWTRVTGEMLRYQNGAVMNAGFAAGPVAPEAVELGGIAPPTPDSAMMIAYVRAIGLKRGDIQEVTLTGPAGEVLAHSRLPPLDQDKAQYLVYVGKKRPAVGWSKGAYTADYTVIRGGEPALRRAYRLTF
ncbi:MAG: M23 family metallopeptidase [Phenylobacterium sp.]|nr:M23 family metallopeptidase [Phenylobacterium sp.]